MGVSWLLLGWPDPLVARDWLAGLAPVPPLAALAAAVVYYIRVVRQNRTTHEFDMLMRTVAVYHDLLPTKRSLVAGLLVARGIDGAYQSSAAERVAMADLARFFDMASWRALTSFNKLSLGPGCRLDQPCTGHRVSVAHRHDAVRALLKDLGVPATMYYLALERYAPAELIEAPLQSHVKFREVAVIASVHVDRKLLLPEFLKREQAIQWLRPMPGNLIAASSPQFKAGRITDESRSRLTLFFRKRPRM